MRLFSTLEPDSQSSFTWSASALRRMSAATRSNSSDAASDTDGAAAAIRRPATMRHAASQPVNIRFI